MPDLPVLGTAVGLLVLFAITALLCSGVTESVSNLLQLRAKYLLTGLRAMLDAPERAADSGRPKPRSSTLHDSVKDPLATKRAVRDVHALTTTDPAPSGPILTTALFDSPLLTSLQSRRIGVLRQGRLRNPQYLSGRTFARALVDLLVPAADDGSATVQVDIDKVRAAVLRLPLGLPLRRQLLAFLSRAGTDLDGFERAVEQWYDEQMAKVAGWYKRWARVLLGAVGLAVAVLANIDTVQVTHSLYIDAPVQQGVIATADTGVLCQGAADATARRACATDALTTLRASGLPIGYPSGCDVAGGLPHCFAWSDAAPWHWWDIPLKVLGWAITAFAVSFGAPFWFEALSRLGSLRTAGTRPGPT